MAESTLSIDYNTLKREVGGFLGWTRDITSFTNTNEQDFDDILARGLRMFYYPPLDGGKPRYEWSFMHKTGTATLNASSAVYVLPDDYGGTILDRSVTYASSKGQRTLQKVDESSIRKFQAMDAQTGYPKYYATRNKTHNAANGQRWEMMVYPSPAAAQANTIITYRYVHVPGTLNSTNKYPVGGAQYGETVLAAVMAAAETFLDNDPAGPYMQRFTLMLNNAIRNDENQKKQQVT